MRCGLVTIGRRLGVVFTLAALGAFVVAAQTRDSPASATGTAVVTGTVLTDDPTPRPLGRAIVTVAGSELPTSRSAVTDDDGRFVIRSLPAGRVTIVSAKRGYVAGAYGAKRPGRPGTPVGLAAGQSFDATIRMSPAGVLTGLIRDTRGDPVSGLRVFAIDAQASVNAPSGPTSRGAGAGTSVNTDDRGIYRIFDLVPGTYVIAAVPTAHITGDILRSSEADVDRELARLRARDSRSASAPAAVSTPTTGVPHPAATLAAVFFPGTAVIDDAARVKVDRGEVRDGLDFVMTAVPVTTIEGTVVNAEGRLPASVQLSILPGSTLRFFGLSSANPQLSRAPGEDGRFVYTTIVPGHYTILARARPLTESAGPGRAGSDAASFDGGRGPGRLSSETPDALYAAETLDVVGGTAVSGVTLRLQRGSRFAGRLAFDGPTQSAPSDLTTIRVALQPINTDNSNMNGTLIGNALVTSASNVVRADGSFEIAGIAPGAYYVRCTLPPDTARGWWLRSALVGGRDALDSSLEVVLGTDVTNALLTLSDRHSELSGTLRTAGGLPATDYYMVVFPADPNLRRAHSRRVVSARPGTDGHFSFEDLPAGEYLLVALTDVEPNEWEQAEFLGQIAPAGIRVILGQGEKKIQDVMIAGGR